MASIVYYPIPNLPHVLYSTGKDAHGQFWIRCKCKACGPVEDYRRPCSNPDRANYWIAYYGKLHAQCDG